MIALRPARRRKAAAAKPQMPPPMMAMRTGGGAITALISSGQGDGPVDGDPFRAAIEPRGASDEPRPRRCEEADARAKAGGRLLRPARSPRPPVRAARRLRSA